MASPSKAGRCVAIVRLDWIAHVREETLLWVWVKSSTKKGLLQAIHRELRHMFSDPDMPISTCLVDEDRLAEIARSPYVRNRFRSIDMKHICEEVK